MSELLDKKDRDFLLGVFEIIGEARSESIPFVIAGSLPSSGDAYAAGTSDALVTTALQVGVEEENV